MHQARGQSQGVQWAHADSGLQCAGLQRQEVRLLPSGVCSASSYSLLQSWLPTAHSVQQWVLQYQEVAPQLTRW